MLSKSTDQFRKRDTEKNEFYIHGSVRHKSVLMKVQRDAVGCSLFYFTAKTLYMFRVSATPIIRSTYNCNRSHRYGSYLTPTWPSWPRWSEVALQLL
jgi:hypothetical protein